MNKNQARENSAGTIFLPFLAPPPPPPTIPTPSETVGREEIIGPLTGVRVRLRAA
jgi:hypothetical protein